MPPSQRRRRPVGDDGESDEDARPRQRPHLEEEEVKHEEEEEAKQEEEEDVEMNASRQRRHLEASEIEQEEETSDEEVEMNDATSRDELLAKKLARYAIACEYSRTSIRRENIKERVLGKHSRSFRRIFGLAQTQLRAVWGMELRKLPVRDKMTLNEKRQAMRSNPRAGGDSGAYVLSSTLLEEYRSASILRPSKTPSAEQEATYMGFYTLLVSLIWLNGGELSEQKLQRSLMRLNADRMLASERTDVVLKKMERQGYVIKRVGRPPVGYEGEQTITWHVGPRAKEEIGLDGVIGLVREVYGYPEDEAFEKKLRSSLGLRSRQPRYSGGEDGNGVRMTNGA